MPKLLVLVSYLTPPDVDGERITRQKEVDVLASLSPALQTAIAAILARITAATAVKYGSEATVDAMRYVP